MTNKPEFSWFWAFFGGVSNRPPRPQETPEPRRSSFWSLFDTVPKWRFIAGGLTAFLLYLAITAAAGAFERGWKQGVLILLFSGCAGAMVMRPPVLGALGAAAGAGAAWVFSPIFGHVPYEILAAPGLFAAWAVTDSLRDLITKNEPRGF